MTAKKWLMITATLALPLAACSQEPSAYVFGIEKMFSKSSPTTLNVATIDVFNEAMGESESAFDDYFTEDVEKWARLRFSPVGSNGTAVIKVTEMKITEHEGKVCNTFMAPAKDEYLATLTVRVSINDAIGFEKSYVENTVKRSTFVPSNINLVERENAVRKLITEVIIGMDEQLSANVKNHLSYNISQ